MQSSIGGLVQRVAVPGHRCIHCRLAATGWPARRDVRMHAKRGSQKVPVVENLEWQMPLTVLKYPDPRLRAPNARIGVFDDKLKQLAQQMFEIMYQDDGVGLAAPQVGVNVRLMVFNETAMPGDPAETVLVNPMVIEKGRATAMDVEGCLSFPGIYADVERSTRIDVQYQDLDGRVQEMQLRDFAARVFQHEYDHLQGVLYHDRMRASELDKVRPELVAMEEAYVAAHPGVEVQRLPPPGKPAAAKAKGFGSIHRTREMKASSLLNSKQPAVELQKELALATASYVAPLGVKTTFYKRKLPCPPATGFSSAEGRLVFAEALQQGTMAGFFKLIEQYSTQDEPAFCGLASIAMVLNALSIDPKRTWKGSWRWFHEQLLDCCLPLDTVATEGLILTQAACLAKCNGANVTLQRYGTFSLEEFREAVAEVCSGGEQHLIVSYSRKTFSQTGDGHFSPVGGYHAGRDLVLVLDVARFKYPPHWVPLPLLFESMSTIDSATGRPRGFFRLSANAQPDSVLFTLDVSRDGSWREAEHFLKVTAPEVVRAAASTGQASSPEALLSQLVSIAPLESTMSFIAVRAPAQLCVQDKCVSDNSRQQVLQELQATPLHQIIEPLLAQLHPGSATAKQLQLQHAQHHSCHQLLEQQQQQEQQQQEQQHQQQQGFLSEKVTLLLLLPQPSAWGLPSDWADPLQHQQWHQLLDASAVSIVEGEVQYMRQQLMHVEGVLHEGSKEGQQRC